MKKITARILLTLLTSFLCINIHAQVNSKKKIKIYETFVYSDNTPNKLKGVLYEIKDSSIIVSNSKLKKDYSTGNFKLAEISFNNINLVKTRRINNAKRGVWKGAVGGLGIVIGMAGVAAPGSPLGEAAVLFSAPIIAAGAVIGALVATHLNKIPVNRSIENFNRNRHRLQKYSYLQEYSYSTNLFEQADEPKGFIGIAYGLSIPLGDFANKSPDNENADFAKTGGSSNIVFGYSVSRNLGISASLFNSKYNADKNDAEMLWKLGGIIAGPLFSTSFKDKFHFDMKPGIGFASSSLVVDNIDEKTGNGLGINLSASFRYNFAKRWCILTESGYLTTSQKFDDKSERKIKAINLGLGIAYRFK